jgi:cyclophilin family peptidyl-prolyl cis-trans isomerase
MDMSEPKNIIIGLVVVVAIFGGVVWLTGGGPAPADKQAAKPVDQQTTNVNNINNETNKNMNNQETTQEKTKATVTTSRGAITLELYPKAAPKTVANFIAKAKAGYFDGLKFHRVEDWVIQGGDLLSRDEANKQMWGTGGGDIETELSLLPFVVGALGVARGGDIKISNDSQFFITKKDSQFLNNQYTLFGQVTGGMDIVNSTQIGDTIKSVVVE